MYYIVLPHTIKLSFAQTETELMVIDLKIKDDFSSLILEFILKLILKLTVKLTLKLTVKLTTLKLTVKALLQGFLLRLF